MRTPKAHVEALAALTLAVGLVYHNSFGNGFHYDDFHSLVDNPHVRSLSHVPAFFADPGLFSAVPERAMYRPLLLVSYALNYRVGGYQVGGYHLVNLVLHLGCAFLVYFLGRQVHGRGGAAFLGSLFFALHPVNAEAVNYISSRSETLAGFFYLAALLGYGRWRQGGGWPYYALSLAAYGGGLLSKSVAVVLPVALVVFELWKRAGGEGGRRWWPYHAGYWCLSLAYVLLAREWLHSSLLAPVRGLGEQVATQVKAMGYYLYLLGAPVRLSVEHSFGEADSLLKGPVLFCLLLLGSGLWLLLRRSAAWLMAAWAVLPLLPSSVVPLNVLVNEHRLYLPSAFVCLGLGYGLFCWGPHRGGKGLALAGALVLGLLVVERNQVWKDELSLWGDAVEKAPLMYRAQMHLGGALEASGRLEEALERYERASRLAPEVVEVHYNRANALRRLGRVEEALNAYGQSLELNPHFMESLVNMAALYQDLGQLQQAEHLLLRASKAHPKSAELQRRLGVLYKAQGRLEEAERAYVQALTLDPSLAEAQYNLGNLYFDQGRLEEAARRYGEALRLRPDHARAHGNLELVQKLLPESIDQGR